MIYSLLLRGCYLIPVELDKLQNDLICWYNNYLHATMTKFEDLILEHHHIITKEAMKH